MDIPSLESLSDYFDDWGSPLEEVVYQVTVLNLNNDGEKEIILRVDNVPSHDVEYAVLKLKCDKLEMHPLFPEVKSYELLDNKKIKIYYKDGYSIKEKIYCFQSIGYLCEEKYIIRNNYELKKLYSSNGKVSSVGIYYNQNKILPSIREKSYLYYDLNKRSNMYLVKGDKVNILDEKSSLDGQSWYFINYKGNKYVD